MSDAADVRPFELQGPLPAAGVTVLEASAGTGKTYTIAALAARYVADGVPLHELLLVTFTRMATGELRDRVRERLVSAEAGLERFLAGAAPDRGDQVLELLVQGSRDEVARRRERLTRALADFDAATITTTHGFCQEVLGGLGVEGDVERDCAFVEDVGDLREEVVDDLYVRKFHGAEHPAFDRKQAGSVARIAVENPAARLEPVDATADSPADLRRRMAEAVRRELEARKRRAAIMTFDDLLTRLHDVLAGERGPAVAAGLRRRYKVVLVDEFQDTDPVQWSIMERAFGEGGTALVLIGDPKQAIYAFRGADVYAYLEAARGAAAQATLEVNRRSDQGLLDAYDALFAGARLGHEGIVYRPVQAAEGNRATRLHGAPVPAPLRIRLVHRDEPGIGLTPRGWARVNDARAHVAEDVAADIVRLLSAAPQRDTADGRDRVPLRPGDVAVLVRTNRAAAAIRDALDALDVPAVINGAGSVFATAPAREWLRLLEALERPASSPRARTAALTPFLGWSAERVAAAGEDEWEEVHRRLHDWARVLRVRGVASLAETVTLLERIPPRVLAVTDGERRLTDLRHVGQLLHAAAAEEQLGTTALTAWLRRRIAEAEQDTGDEERSRRLESDAEAVQVLTVHRSKGLEFPVVYCPDLWEPGPVPRDGEPIAFHDPAAGDRRTVDVGLDGPAFRAHREQHILEQRGEDLRLAYVALTRARHQAVIWWAGSWDSRNSALSRLLFSRAEDGTVPAFADETPTDEAALARFERLAAEASPGCIAVERSTLGLPVAWSAGPSTPAELSAARFDRELDRRWRRTSYSDITAGAHDARVASEPEDADVVTDELDDEAAPGAPSAPTELGDVTLMTTPSLLGDMPVGVHVGTLVHRVLEATDFAAPDLDAELRAQVAAAQARRRVDVGDPALVVAGLRAMLETPLGPVLDDLRLRDLTRADRLDELAFELPLAGGERPSGALELGAVAAVLREHLPPGDPLAGYAARLEDPALRATVRGFLTGSIDLVIRMGDRFAIADHKTNRLAAPGESLTAWHHRPAALAAEMERRHYGLQALLYTAALHRYLRWRLPAYDPERQLAGVVYLFLRGMTGADTPRVDGAPCGVFAWRPPVGLVDALSDVLDGGAA